MSPGEGVREWEKNYSIGSFFPPSAKIPDDIFKKLHVE